MAENEKSETAAPNAQPNSGPSLNIVAQYIRDLSFENPGAPNTLLNVTSAPQFNININVQVKKQADELYAVELTINAKADRDASLVFNLELVYGGVFRLRNIPENQLAPILMVECPRMIFPFARQVLASVSQAGGFPPLMMEPVDFFAIYQQNLANMAKQSEAAGAAKPN